MTLCPDPDDIGLGQNLIWLGRAGLSHQPLVVERAGQQGLTKF
jgi:hypothetical protein